MSLNDQILREMCANSVEKVKLATSNAANEMLKVAKLVDERLQVLREHEANWSRTQQQMADHAAKAADKITLDVGGKLFSTTKQTLLKYEGSYFHAMLASGMWQPDQNGAYFIDMDAEHFERLMHFLRTGERDLAGLHAHQQNKLHKLANYFQVPLMPPLSWDPQSCGHHLTLSEDHTVVTKTSGGGTWNNAVLGSTSCEFFCVRLDRFRGVMIGFAPRATFNVNSASCKRYGWYYSAHDGKIWSGNGVTNQKYHEGGMQVGSTLTVLYDFQRKEISFELDGTSLGVAFRSVSRAIELYPAVIIGTEGLQLTLVQ